MKVKKYTNNGGWIEAKRKNSKSGSKESSVKSSTSNASNNSGKQVENMKKIIREEGRDARNLLYWTVPPSKEKHINVYGRSKSETRIGQVSSESLRGRTPRQTNKFNDQMKKNDIRARYWGYLFENLRRAVDKIYSTCELDQSILECQETLLIIEAYRHDFTELKKLLELKKEHDFDNNNGKNSMRGISWEVRKTSPGPRKLPADGEKFINLRSPLKTPRSPGNPSGSWASRVRGDHIILSEEPIVPRLQLDEIGEDGENDTGPRTPENDETRWDEDTDWADIMNVDESFQLKLGIDYREPGRLASVHEKLMSPSRKKSEKDSEMHRLEIEMRQNEAARRREEIQRSKAEKVRKIVEKVESVQKNKSSVQMEKQKKLDQKMKRAELNKETKKTNFKNKLRDESQKIREANFIQELEQDIKRVETEKKIQKYQKQTEKHASTLEEQKELKTREIEQKERAVIERKRKLESDRQSWVFELNRRRDQRLQEITQKHEEEKMSLLKAAKEKESKREEILRGKRENEEKGVEEVKNKIMMKHIEAEKRRLEELEKKKGKAAELASFSQMSPRSVERAAVHPHTHSLQTISHASRKLIFVESETEFENVSHLASASHPTHQENKNTKKNLKKKLKKIKMKMAARQEAFEEQLNGENPPLRSKGKLGKLIGDITRTCLLQSRDSGEVWPNNRQSALDRSLLELNRLIGQASLGDTLPLTGAFFALLEHEKLAEKTVRNIADLLRRCRPICSASLMASSIPILIINRLMTNKNELSSWNLLDSLAWLMMSSYEAETGAELSHLACQDAIIYSLAYELFTTCDECTSSELAFNGTISSAIFAFLTGSVRTLLLSNKKPTWYDEFIAMLTKTELLGAVSILYGSIVLERNSHNGTDGIILNAEAERTSMLVLQAINYCSLLDLEMVQKLLSSAGMTSQFRSVMQCLLTSNVPTNIKHEAILSICYYVQRNYINQEKIGQGEQPTILQQLCLLPFDYYSDDNLKSILFPAMCCACFNNGNNCHIVQKEVSLVHLASFLTDSLKFNVKEDRADKWNLHNRFPSSDVGAAIDYFLSFANDET